MKTIVPVRAVLVGLMLVTGFTVDPQPWEWMDKGIVSSAEARVGRPATPVSVAGVARRTTRRVIRRTAYYVAVLPVGCPVVMINGSNLYYCGGVYYQPYGNQYVVVVID